MDKARTEAFVVVRIGAGVRLIELAEVREIVPAMKLATPHGIEGTCRGVARVRGEVLPVFDLARRTGPLETSQLIVVTRSIEHTQLGILVDDVLDVLELAHGVVLAHPTGGGRIMRATQLAGEVVSVLTPSEVLHA